MLILLPDFNSRKKLHKFDHNLVGHIEGKAGNLGKFDLSLNFFFQNRDIV